MARINQIQRKEYWLKAGLLLGELALMFAIVLVALELLDANNPNAPTAQQVVAVACFAVLLLNAAAVYIAMLLLMLRRARDTGFTIVMFVVGAFVPFGFVVLGCVPSQRTIK